MTWNVLCAHQSSRARQVFPCKPSAHVVMGIEPVPAALLISESVCKECSAEPPEDQIEDQLRYPMGPRRGFRRTKRRSVFPIWLNLFVGLQYSETMNAFST